MFRMNRSQHNRKLCCKTGLQNGNEPTENIVKIWKKWSLCMDKSDLKGKKKEAGKIRKPKEQTEPDMVENDIEFDVRFRGYDRKQVQEYIDALTDDYNKICARCEELEEMKDILTNNANAVGLAMIKAEATALRIVSEARKEAAEIRQKSMERGGEDGQDHTGL